MNLTRRTNLLLTDDDYFALKSKASEEGKTIGGVLRELISQNVTNKSKKRLGIMKMLEEIKEMVKDCDLSGLNYKDLVNYGRKY